MSKQIVMWSETSNDYYAKQMSGGMWEVIHCTDGGNYVIGYTMQPVIYMDACEALQIDGSKITKINPEPTDEPAVDMVGDFEGFVEAVNAPEPTPAQEIAQRNQYWADLTKKYERATDEAIYNWGHMPLSFEEFCDAQMDTAPKPDYDAIARESVRNNRIERLQKRIASQERELIDLRFELSQLLGGDE